LVGCQAAIAGKPAPTGFGVHLQEIGRLAGRHRWQASSHRVRCTPARDWSAGGAPSLAGQLPQGMSTSEREIDRLAGRQGQDQKIAASLHSTAPTGGRCTPEAPNHSTGRAVARLQLLILIHPPLREAEWRRSSGGRRVAPFDEVEHIERRSKRSRPEAMPPDECRNEGTPSPSEGPDAGARPFGSFWGVCQKGLAVRAKP
jgi:hypothetical protein